MAGFRVQPAGVGMTIRPMTAGDREDVREMLEVSQAFSHTEVEVALDLVDAGVAAGPEGDYALLVAEVGGLARGYVCIGRTSFTLSTWHLYWICVHPDAQRC